MAQKKYKRLKQDRDRLQNDFKEYEVVKKKL